MKKGFTLLELIIVVIILGILVTVALPRLTAQTERARASEAVNLLGALRASNERYAAQNSLAYLVNGTCTGLDTTYTAPRNFQAPVCSDATNGNIAMTRLPIATSYTLRMNAAGCLCCVEIAGTPSCTDAAITTCTGDPSSTCL